MDTWLHVIFVSSHRARNDISKPISKRPHRDRDGDVELPDHCLPEVLLHQQQGVLWCEMYAHVEIL